MGISLVLMSVALVTLASSPSSGAAGGGQAALGGAPTGLPTAPAKAPEPPGLGGLVTRFPSSPALIARGQSLYQNGCASCHGPRLRGIPGVAPSLIGVGAGPVDFYLSTGRMPLQSPRVEPTRAKPLYTEPQIHALIAYIVARGGGPPAPGADPADGSLAQGFAVFTANCAGCHQILGRGGLTIGAYVPNLQRATALQIAEAVRMGPYVMPHFDATQIDQRRLDSLARYVLWTRHPDNAGGWGIGNIGPIPEGMVAWFIALLALVIVARLIGERTA
ncbi:MAG: cytochrome bc1 complex diheme cytochrome c subunit [Solirubrobacteraceae bacterium]